VVAAEQDPAQLAVAMERRDGFGFANVDFRHGDARTFLDEEPFDAVVSGCCSCTCPALPTGVVHRLSAWLPWFGITLL
jgi:protein-L-isoaspartate O-methyltransferase